MCGAGANARASTNERMNENARDTTRPTQRESSDRAHIHTDRNTSAIHTIRKPILSQLDYTKYWHCVPTNNFSFGRRPEKKKN